MLTGLWKQLPDVAVDFGTANTLVYARGLGLIPMRNQEQPVTEFGKDFVPDDFILPSVVAREKFNGRRVRFGEFAYEMMGRCGPHVEILRPVERGQMQDEEIFLEVLKHITARVSIVATAASWDLKRVIGKPRMIIGVPHNTHDLQHNAMKGLIRRVGFEPSIVSEAVAAAVGAGLPIDRFPAYTIADIGGGTMDLAVMSAYDVSFPPYSEEIGGDEMNREITAHVLNKHRVEIGWKSAEFIKRGLASPTPIKEHREVKGRSQETGQPEWVKVTGDEISACLAPIFKRIADAIRTYLGRIQEGQLHSDIMDNGICLTGGGSMVKNLDTYLSKETHLKIHKASNRLLSVVLGAGRMLEDKHLLTIGEQSLVTHEYPERLP